MSTKRQNAETKLMNIPIPLPVPCYGMPVTSPLTPPAYLGTPSLRKWTSEGIALRAGTRLWSVYEDLSRPFHETSLRGANFEDSGRKCSFALQVAGELYLALTSTLPSVGRIYFFSRSECVARHPELNSALLIDRRS